MHPRALQTRLDPFLDRLLVELSADTDAASVAVEKIGPGQFAEPLRIDFEAQAFDEAVGEDPRGRIAELQALEHFRDLLAPFRRVGRHHHQFQRRVFRLQSPEHRQVVTAIDAIQRPQDQHERPALMFRGNGLIAAAHERFRTLRVREACRHQRDHEQCQPPDHRSPRNGIRRWPSCKVLHDR